MKRAWVWVALVLSLGINIGVLATIGVTRLRTKARWEQPRPEGRPDMGRFADHLRLRGGEREQFVEIQRRLFETARQKSQELESLRAELRREMSTAEPDPVKIDEFLTRSGEVYQALDRAFVESILASREILTPEQQQRYFHILTRMREGAMRFGPRGGPPGGPPTHRPRNRRPPS